MIVTVMVFVVRFYNHCLDIHVFSHANNMKFCYHPSHCGHNSKDICNYCIGGRNFEVSYHQGCPSCYNKNVFCHSCLDGSISKLMESVLVVLMVIIERFCVVVLMGVIWRFGVIVLMVIIGRFVVLVVVIGRFFVIVLMVIIGRFVVLMVIIGRFVVLMVVIGRFCVVVLMVVIGRFCVVVLMVVIGRFCVVVLMVIIGRFCVVVMMVVIGMFCVVPATGGRRMVSSTRGEAWDDQTSTDPLCIFPRSGKLRWVVCFRH